MKRNDMLKVHVKICTHETSMIMYIIGINPSKMAFDKYEQRDETALTGETAKVKLSGIVTMLR